MVSSYGSLRHIIATLAEEYGPQHWWPADSPFEVMVGAILTQNTAWTNVEKAITNLKAANALSPVSLNSLTLPEIETLIRPSGFFRQKAKRLKIFIAWLQEKCRGDIDILKKTDTAELRAELLSLNGIGPETADAILLYALEKPVFVVDAYTVRLLARHGLTDADAQYQDVQKLAHNELPKNAGFFNEAHALLVQVGKRHCFNREPDCEKKKKKKYLPVNSPKGVST